VKPATKLTLVASVRVERQPARKVKAMSHVTVRCGTVAVAYRTLAGVYSPAQALADFRRTAGAWERQAGVTEEDLQFFLRVA
jgi:hypothetical protein